MRKLVGTSGINYGIIGTSTDSTDVKGNIVHVGDVISYKYSSKYLRAVVADCGGCYSPMGLCGTNLENLKDVFIVLPYKFLTEDIACSFHNLKIEEFKPKKMTLKEIETILGYPVEIAEG